MTVIGSEEAHQETGTLSATPMPMDGEGAAGLYERGGRQPDSKIGDRINTPTDTPANDYSRMAAASPAASAKGERSVSSLALPDGHSHVSPPPAAPLPSSVYFEVQPPDAGRVRVHLALSDQTVYARVVTEQSEVQDFLVRNVGRLESQLQSYGLDVGRFHVEVDRQDQGQSHHPWTQAGEPGQTATRVSGQTEAGRAQEGPPLEPAGYPYRVSVFV